MDHHYEQFETLVTQAEKPKFIHSQNQLVPYYKTLNYVTQLDLVFHLWLLSVSVCKRKVETELQTKCAIINTSCPN